ncbi:hypothetical protein AGMMS50256_38860 [Betaproteobacteria bacterium]|nr:hypothetical protein AGMMS50256_38860 [Betaproteobacteria bacterium]
MKAKMLYLFSALASFLMVPFGVAFAADGTPPDFSTLTSSVDFSTAITAVLLVMAGLAGVFIVIRGGKLILSMLRGG